jgi:hypothetical protein
MLNLLSALFSAVSYYFFFPLRVALPAASSILPSASSSMDDIEPVFFYKLMIQPEYLGEVRFFNEANNRAYKIQTLDNFKTAIVGKHSALKLALEELLVYRPKDGAENEDVLIKTKKDFQSYVSSDENPFIVRIERGEIA